MATYLIPFENIIHWFVTAFGTFRQKTPVTKCPSNKSGLLPRAYKHKIIIFRFTIAVLNQIEGGGGGGNFHRRQRQKFRGIRVPTTYTHSILHARTHTRAYRFNAAYLLAVADQKNVKSYNVRRSRTSIALYGYRIKHEWSCWRYRHVNNKCTALHTESMDL